MNPFSALVLNKSKSPNSSNNITTSSGYFPITSSNPPKFFFLLKLLIVYSTTSITAFLAPLGYWFRSRPSDNFITPLSNWPINWACMLSAIIILSSSCLSFSISKSSPSKAISFLNISNPNSLPSWYAKPSVAPCLTDTFVFFCSVYLSTKKSSVTSSILSSLLLITCFPSVIPLYGPTSLEFHLSIFLPL